MNRGSFVSPGSILLNQGTTDQMTCGNAHPATLSKILTAPSVDNLAKTYDSNGVPLGSAEAKTSCWTRRQAQLEDEEEVAVKQEDADEVMVIQEGVMW